MDGRGRGIGIHGLVYGLWASKRTGSDKDNGETQGPPLRFAPVEMTFIELAKNSCTYLEWL